MTTLRAPWHHEGAARKLIGAVVDRRYPPTAFRTRFGDEVLLDVMDGEGVQALAWALALEAAADRCVAMSDDPVVDLVLANRNRCEHWQEDGATFDLHRRRVYCDDCELEMIRVPDETFAEACEKRDGPDDYDRCNVCEDLGEVAPFRVLLGARWVEGRACEACRAYAGLT